MLAAVAPNTWRKSPTRGKLADDFREMLYSTPSTIRCMKLSTEDLRQLTLSVLRRTQLGPIFPSVSNCSASDKGRSRPGPVATGAQAVEHDHMVMWVLHESHPFRCRRRGSLTLSPSQIELEHAGGEDQHGTISERTFFVARGQMGRTPSKRARNVGTATQLERADLAPDQWSRLAMALTAARATIDQAQAFVRAWTVKHGDLPVVDTITLDAAGAVIATGSVSLFGSASADDCTRLAMHRAACQQSRETSLSLLDRG